MGTLNILFYSKAYYIYYINISCNVIRDWVAYNLYAFESQEKFWSS